MPRGPARAGSFAYGGKSGWKRGTERAGGRSESATVGVGIGIDDTEGIKTLLALTKA